MTIRPYITNPARLRLPTDIDESMTTLTTSAASPNVTATAVQYLDVMSAQATQPVPAPPVFTAEEERENTIQEEITSARTRTTPYGGENQILAQDITLYPTHVEMELKGIKKAISLLDFKTLLDQQLQVDTKLDTLAMPFNTFVFAKNATEIQLSCYYPSRKLEVTHQNTNVKKFKAAFPNVIISHKLAMEDGYWMVKKTIYLCTNKAVGALPDNRILFEPDATTGTYIMPFPNFYNDGRMCYGQNTMQYKFTNNLRGLDYYYQILGLSAFNNDLGVPGVKRDIATSPRAWFEHLAKLDEFDYTNISSFKA